MTTYRKVNSGPVYVGGGLGCSGYIPPFSYYLLTDVNDRTHIPFQKVKHCLKGNKAKCEVFGVVLLWYNLS